MIHFASLKYFFSSSKNKYAKKVINIRKIIHTITFLILITLSTSMSTIFLQYIHSYTARVQISFIGNVCFKRPLSVNKKHFVKKKSLYPLTLFLPFQQKLKKPNKIFRKKKISQRLIFSIIYTFRIHINPINTKNNTYMIGETSLPRFAAIMVIG